MNLLGWVAWRVYPPWAVRLAQRRAVRPAARPAVAAIRVPAVDAVRPRAAITGRRVVAGEVIERSEKVKHG